jgi:hypothetical protein
LEAFAMQGKQSDPAPVSTILSVGWESWHRGTATQGAGGYSRANRPETSRPPQQPAADR